MCFDAMKIDAHFDSLQPHEYEPIMKTCPICEREYDEDDMRYDVCDSCLNEKATFENAMQFGAARKEEIEINAYLAYEFTTEQIETILKNELNFARVMMDSKHDQFCHQDDYDFASWLVERKGK